MIVPETITLAKLHTVMQAAMGWSDYHLHEYEIAGQRYSIPDPDWPSDEPLLEERRAKLRFFVEARVRRFTYQYDFGDSWEHEVTIEDLRGSKCAGHF